MSRTRTHSGSLLVALLLTSTGAGAEPSGAKGPEQLPDLTQMPAMNGIDPKTAAAFWDTWHQVTVRFRQDSGEQRFIYANDIAWAALNRGSATMPDGAMFGKVAFTTTMDPAFPNSVEPKVPTRIQLMRKDSRRYPQANGWGYALYLVKHATKVDDEAVVATACHACHALVADRDYIFSSPVFLPRARQEKEPSSPRFLDQFKPVPAAALPTFSRGVAAFFQVQGPLYYLRMPLFSGSLDESINPLLAATRVTGHTYLLADEEHRHFLLVKSQAPSGDCPARAAVIHIKFLGQSSLISDHGALQAMLREGQSCQGPIAWSVQPLPDPLK
jgi:hypothetical protein